MSGTISVSSTRVLSLAGFVSALILVGAGLSACSFQNETSSKALHPSSEGVTHQSLSEAAQTFLTAITYIARGEAEAAAAYISYPLTRPAPLASIPDAEAFVHVFPTLFNDQVRASLTESLQKGEIPELIGWRGYAYQQGRIWGDEMSGKIYVLNALSDAESALVEQMPPEQKESWISPE